MKLNNLPKAKYWNRDLEQICLLLTISMCVCVSNIQSVYVFISGVRIQAPVLHKDFLDRSSVVCELTWNGFVNLSSKY